MSDSKQPHRRQPTRLPHPWDSPGKNTGVGCHFLLQCMKVKSEGKLLSCARLFTTPWTAAHQAPPSMGFSRQEYWSRVPLPSPECAPRCLQTGPLGLGSPFPSFSVASFFPPTKCGWMSLESQMSTVCSCCCGLTSPVRICAKAFTHSCYPLIACGTHMSLTDNLPSNDSHVCLFPPWASAPK